jgi:hypothetical protein
MKVIRASRFAGDVAAALRFFLDRDAVRTATRFLVAIEGTIGAIEHSPEIGIRVESIRHRNVRLRPIRGFRNYLIAFRRGEQSIIVMRLVLGWQDLDRVLNE